MQAQQAAQERTISDLRSQITHLLSRQQELPPEEGETSQPRTSALFERVPLGIFKTMCNFSGERNKYPTWRKIVMTAMENIRGRCLASTIVDATLITGLNDRKGELLYAVNPKTLPDAYDRLQTIIYDKERMKFVSQYNRAEVKAFHISVFQTDNWGHKTELPKNDLRPTFLSTFRDLKEKEVEPMDVDAASTKVGKAVAQSFLQGQFAKRKLSNNSRLPTTSQQRMKTQRINTLKANTEVEPQTEESSSEQDDTFEEDSESISSIFLG